MRMVLERDNVTIQKNLDKVREHLSSFLDPEDGFRSGDSNTSCSSAPVLLRSVGPLVPRHLLPGHQEGFPTWRLAAV